MSSGTIPSSLIRAPVEGFPTQEGFFDVAPKAETTDILEPTDTDHNWLALRNELDRTKAERDSWEAQFHSAAAAASEYSEFWEKHNGDFDQFGNYIPYSQMDGDLRAAKAEIELLRALADDTITWRPISCAPKQERVFLYAPPENLSDKPDQEPEYRVARSADFCWATLWMEIRPPIKAAPMVKRTTHG